MTQTDRELEELLREHEDLRPIVEAAKRTLRVQPVRRRHSARRVPALVAVAAVAAVVLLALGLSRGSSGFNDRAAAAIGNGQMIHLRLEQREHDAETVRLSDGQATPERVVTDYWFDVLQHRLRAITRAGGLIVADTTTTIEKGASATGPVRLQRGRTTLVAAPILALVTRYRDALMHSASATGADGQTGALHWFALPGAPNARVGVDATSLEPTLLEDGTGGQRRTQRILLFKAVSPVTARREVRALITAAESSGRATDVRPVRVAQLPSLVSRRAVWLGRSIGNPAIPLNRIELQQLQDDSQRPEVSGAELVYGRMQGASIDWDAHFVVLRETASAEAAYGFLPPSASVRGTALPGTLRIERSARHDHAGAAVWNGKLLLPGPLYVAIQASSRALLIEAARSLRRATPAR